MVSIDEFRKMALSFSETKELDHWGRPSFRVRGKIFSTIWPDQGLAMIKLSLVDQSVFNKLDPDIFYPVPGGWGRKGATFVQLKKLRKSMLKEVLLKAWTMVAPKVSSKKTSTLSKSNMALIQKETDQILDRVRAVLMPLPGVTEGLSYGTAGFHVNKKFLARIKEDGETLVVRTSDRDIWLDADPSIFFITDHYLHYPAVLVRLTKVRQKDLQKLLLDAWQEGSAVKSRTKKKDNYR
jgi:hypothetical protein